MEPSTLNSKCPIAALFADTFAPIEANRGVIVVPILLPKIKAAAMSNEIQPLLHMIKNIAIDALDDCTIIVRIAPTAQNPKIEMNPCCV